MKKLLAIIISLVMVAALFAGCGSTGGNTVRLDPKNPTTITIWHYYNGPLLNAFQASIREFNETVGLEVGIIVESHGLGSVSELEKAVISSANNEIGSMDMPNIFASFPDTAYEAEKMGLLANLDDYFTSQEQEEYLRSYIEEGRIGLNGELRIFPIAKATEVLMVNETDWRPFAAANGVSDSDLETIEGVVRVSEMYYNWSGGKSLFGRDAMANLFIVGSMAFGVEIFEVNRGVGSINVDRDVMRLIWDNYYVPYINGFFSSYGRFRSDDAKVGDILMYVGSTSSAAFFPTEVTHDGVVHPITATVLPVPVFEDGASVLVQQGAGMVVTKGTPEQEFASVEFLKWFTGTRQNIEFAALTGYMPVKNEATDHGVLISHFHASGAEIDPLVLETLRVALEKVNTSELYTNKAFGGGTAARRVLETNLQEKAVADRESIVELIAGGMQKAEAVAQFNTDAGFNIWLDDLTARLLEAAG